LHTGRNEQPRHPGATGRSRPLCAYAVAAAVAAPDTWVCARCEVTRRQYETGGPRLWTFASDKHAHIDAIDVLATLELSEIWNAQIIEAGRWGWIESRPWYPFANWAWGRWSDSRAIVGRLADNIFEFSPELSCSGDRSVKRHHRWRWGCANRI